MTEMARSTSLTRLGRPHAGWANTPIVKGSTYIFESIDQWRDARARREHERVLSYGARGNETVHALEDAVTALEGGHRSQLFPTGLAAIAAAMLGCLKSGDHVLISEGVYEPVHRLFSGLLANYGITHSFFKANDEAWVNALRPHTRMVYAESPGSLLYDMLDLPAMAQVCRERGILLCADNTWGSSLNYRPLELGCDLSIVAATKYLGGHSDVMMGAVTANERTYAAIEDASVSLGQTVSAEDAFLILRGLRTLALRLARHAASALDIAVWLTEQKAVRSVFHPAMPGDASHALWRRDACGSNGLLTVEFDPALASDAVERAVDGLELFGIGASWGGYESLALPVNPERTRLAGQECGYLLRLHIGLEEPEDLKRDLARQLATLA
ncbi:cystathionine beta-lyase [Pusillimonas sp. TS35]|uniref:cystathionine beta-lyase n=1 Tax=Paracandidimonas lactea TaxID=2895524 RepID=UPI00136AA19E|nr:cystathionine beta-lyase [Paracandidimonas lactea]MYN12800.1 cystathionine beta-lyase [Pusillimonas sp. TS35]